MGAIQSFERRLQGLVDGTFARMFGGSVQPAEVALALQNEAQEHLTAQGSRTIAPNSYLVRLGTSDRRSLGADQQSVAYALSGMIRDYLDEQNWQTFGDVVVTLEDAPALHTGQFRVSSRVDPDVDRRARRSSQPSPGVGQMSQHPDQQYDQYGNPINPPGQSPQSGQQPAQPPAPQQGYQQYDPNAYQQYGQQPGPYPPAQPQPGYPPVPSGQQPAYQQPPAQYDPAYQQYAPPAQAPQYGQPAYPQQQPPSGAQPQPGYAQPQPGYGQPDYGQGYQQAAPADVVAVLSVDDGSHRTYQLQRGSNIVGRGQDAGFRLPDTSVSRRHIDIYFDGQVSVLHDLGSTNGTTVNGSSVQTWQLADGDVIRVGHSTVVFNVRG